MEYRVTKELLLQIAEFCDRKTLLCLLQTNKDINALVSDHERSISAAKLKKFTLPPQTQLLTSKDEERRAIPEKNSFATVQELELRELRFRSILDHGGFFFTACAKSLGLTVWSLNKHKAGLKRAMYISDRLADIEADQKYLRTKGEILNEVRSLQFNDTSAESVAVMRDAEYQGDVEITKILRARQVEVIRDCSTLDLAFLLTLCEGAMVGWQRHMTKLARSDVLFYHKVDAFGELLLREGSFIIWAFVRGTGKLLGHARQNVTTVAESIWLFEVGFDQDDPNLTMALQKELNERFFKARDEGDRCFAVTEQEDMLEDPFENPLVVNQWVHKLVGKEIGCEEWKGYFAIEQ